MKKLTDSKLKLIHGDLQAHHEGFLGSIGREEGMAIIEELLELRLRMKAIATIIDMNAVITEKNDEAD